jgi:hypothetical protein
MLWFPTLSTMKLRKGWGTLHLWIGNAQRSYA